MNTTDYEKQANDFMEKTGTIMKINYSNLTPSNLINGSFARKYNITLKNKRSEYTFDFTDSIRNTEKLEFVNSGITRISTTEQIKLAKKYGITVINGKVPGDELRKIRGGPSSYDILACLTKYEPGSFDDFCNEYGYDNDSIKAFETWKNCHAEYSGVMKLFGNFINELQEIA